ncbi:MAG: hypothetical protein LBV58_01890 [Acholeplasmatales bacterium]|jgi:plastocyanin domain-containing protein|nr:hypothetical protein [Acholeplasmatales bacterium]
MANQKTIERIKRQEEIAKQKAIEKKIKRNKIIIIMSSTLGVVLLILTLILVFSNPTKIDSDGNQIVSTTMTFQGSKDITVKVGQPVKWTIKGANAELGCMDGVKSDLFSFNGVFSNRESTVRFTPRSRGTYRVTCSHGNEVCIIKVV